MGVSSGWQHLLWFLSWDYLRVAVPVIVIIAVAGYLAVRVWEKGRVR